MVKKKKTKNLIRRMALRAGGLLLAALLVAVFYVAVIMAEPRGRDGLAAAQDQPVLDASPAVVIASEGELGTLLASFPVQVLCCPAGSGLPLVSGISYDVAYEGGFARVAETVYDLGSGQQMKAVSIYPARATGLLGKGDWTLSSGAGAAIAGIVSARMENETAVRMHMQSENGLYAVVLPKADATALAAFLRPLQLLGGE